MRVRVGGDGAVDVVAAHGLGNDVRVEGVEEVVGLVGEGGRAGGEVALAGKGEEHGGVLHHFDEGLVEVVLHGLDDAADLGGESGHLDHLRRCRVDGEQPSPDLRYHEQNVCDNLREFCPSPCEFFDITHHVGNPRGKGEDTR